MDEALDDDAVALYRIVLARSGITDVELAEQVAAQRALSPDAIGKSVASLEELGLVQRDPDGALQPVNPMLAEAVVLGNEELELTWRHIAVESKRQTIRRLVPDWNNSLTPDLSKARVEVVTGLGPSSSLMMHYAETSRFELLSVAPGRLPAHAMQGNYRAASIYSLNRGVRTRALYQHSALRDRATVTYLSQLAESGAQIRFAAAVPGRSLVIDREIAILPVPPSEPGGPPGVAVVREPHVVDWIIATFEQLWTEAGSLEDLTADEQSTEVLDQTRTAILRLMAEGEKDEAISRRLSISVRTCRRHIADYMAQVGASSRFQAGVIAARSGHLEVSHPSVDED